jgi:hypothetical protein
MNRNVLGMVWHFIIHLEIFQINIMKMFNNVVIWKIIVLLNYSQKQTFYFFFKQKMYNEHFIFILFSQCFAHGNAD